MHLDGRLPTDWGARHGSSLLRRAEPPTQTIAFVVVGVIVFIIIICSIAAIYTRRKKGSTRSAGQKTKEGRRWSRLNPFKSHARRYQAASDGHDSSELNATSSNTRQDVEQATRTETSRNSNNAGATVDRNASIRSVMTLPAYRRAASNTEQVLGREGERGGVDVVVDFPTNQDEEALREQEMDALYQLRATRRQQQAERDELRRQRREAQRRNDYATLTELRNRARAASNSNQSLVDELRRDIDRAKENRQRSVSSVSYADLGVARHDGTRLRANSQESERMGLLSDAADMGHHTRSGANSPNPQGRHRSTSDVSADSEIPSPGLAGAHGDSQRGTPRFSTQSARSHGGRAGSSPELVDGDLGVEAMPPPEYEDVSLDDNDRSTTPMHEPPPDYPGPYRSDSQRSRRSQFEREQAQVQAATEQEAAPAPRGRGVGGVPQLPSLRIGRLPEIVIEPSSAHPRDDDIDENGISPERH